MQSHRLARLLRIIVEIRSQPEKPPETIAKDLGISVRQFYYDRNQLAHMGFAFSRSKGRFSILRDPVVTIGELPLSEVLALVLATRHLFATKDFSIVWRALNGLFTIVDHMPAHQKGLLRSLIQDVIIKDGFGCSPEILADVMRAIDEKRRILVHSKQRPEGKPQSLDPYKLCFRKSKLYVDAYAVEKKRRIRYRVANIQKVVFTLFYRPESVHLEAV
jgi:predicted DNA-binding transcriptional regulator YafY